MSDFENKIGALVAKELTASHGDSDRLGAMIESVARLLGLVVAVSCRGQPEAIDEIMVGVEDYVHAEAVNKAPFAKMMSAAPIARSTPPVDNRPSYKEEVAKAMAAPSIGPGDAQVRSMTINELRRAFDRGELRD